VVKVAEVAGVVKVAEVAVEIEVAMETVVNGEIEVAMETVVIVEIEVVMATGENLMVVKVENGVMVIQRIVMVIDEIDMNIEEADAIMVIIMVIDGETGIEINMITMVIDGKILVAMKIKIARHQATSHTHNLKMEKRKLSPKNIWKGRKQGTDLRRRDLPSATLADMQLCCTPTLKTKIAQLLKTRTRPSVAAKLYTHTHTHCMLILS
jgi:hypothetical protein